MTFPSQLLLRPSRIVLFGLFMLLQCGPLAGFPRAGFLRAARAETADLQTLVPAAIEYYDEFAQRPIPGLGESDLKALLKGKVVVSRRKEKSSKNPETVDHRVFGYLIVDQPVRSVWLSGNDPDYLHNSTYTLTVYDRDGHGGDTAYLYFHAPWPLADRQTVTKVTTNVELAAASENWIWEQYWDIAPQQKRIARELVSAGKIEGVSEEMVKSAVWLPVNYGAFICFKLEEKKTLFVWTVTASLGGKIPDSLVAAFAANQFKSSLREIADRAVWIEKDYREHPDEIYGGDGQVIPPLDAP